MKGLAFAGPSAVDRVVSREMKMPLPQQFIGKLSLPVVVAPMFLASGPDLVIACCKAGLVGTFPVLNQRTSEGLAEWFERITARLTPHDAPFGVNLIVHKTNPRLKADLDLVVRYKIPLVITSMGAAPEVVEAVHSYGGLAFHDVTGLRHAKKAAATGVDGLVLVAAGAGGHAGTLNPFALVSEVRNFFEGTILLGGAISRGEQIAAAQLLGADLAYIGTRFLATRECMVDEGHKAMVVSAQAEDIVYTPAISGVPASFLRQSIAAAGLDPRKLPDAEPMDVGKESETEARAWKTVWSAGQGVGSIADVPSVAELTERLVREYEGALDYAQTLRADRKR
jgi:nitronate monooxygenase